MLRQIALILMLCPALVFAKPAAPDIAPPLGTVTFGIFCTIAVSGQTDAPGTLTGFIHTVDEAPGFDWSGQRTVPASLGIAFGVKAQTTLGTSVPFAVMHVFRPGRPLPDVWTAGFDDTDPSFAFFRFDTEAELIPGLWAFEAWDAGKRLYRVEFEIVPADQAIGIASACGGVS